MSTADDLRTRALNRIAAAIEDSAKANREWFALNRPSVKSRVAADTAYLELTRLQIEEAKKRLLGPKIEFMSFGDTAKAYNPPETE
jgi:hypothetical protein